MNVGVGTISVEVFEVSNCAAPTLPSFDAPERESGVVPCARLSAALVPAAAKTACATEAAVAAVTAADIAAAEMAAADACANAAAGAPAASAASAEEPLPAAAPDGRSAESGSGALGPCAIAAAMAACEAASAPAVAGPLLKVESFGALESVDEGAESANAVDLKVAVVSLNLAVRVLPVGTAEPVAAVDVSAIGGARKLAACGTRKPEPVAVGPLAGDGAGASTLIAGVGEVARTGGAAGVGVSGAAGSRFGKVKPPVAPLGSPGAVDAPAMAPGTDPGAPP